LQFGRFNQSTTWRHQSRYLDARRRRPGICPLAFAGLRHRCNDRIKELVQGKMAIVQFTATMEERISRLEQHFTESTQRLELFERQKTEKDMELVAINFQLPRHLRQELNIYCNLNHISVREIFTNYLKTELLKK
jgi:hypothetical protein